MFSIARDGFPALVGRQLQRLDLENAVGVFAFGEIDCRVHLPQRLRQGALELAFVDRYVDRVVTFAEAVGMRDVVIASPTPPSDLGEHNPDYPRAGSLSDRVQVTAAVRTRLMRNANNVAVLNLEEVVAGEGGALREALTDDGCHVNPCGSDMVRGALDRMIERRTA